jgi:hypothetical protein
LKIDVFDFIISASSTGRLTEYTSSSAASSERTCGDKKGEKIVETQYFASLKGGWVYVEFPDRQVRDAKYCASTANKRNHAVILSFNKNTP